MQDTVLVLGAYGLAGRAIVRGLIEDTPYRVVAAGRDAARLEELVSQVGSDRITARVLDVADRAMLRAACKDSGLVVNAVGPYAVHGAHTAAVVLDAGRSCIDFANEQIHFRRLRELEEQARARGLWLVSAAGAIPGYSTLLAALALQRFPAAERLDIYWAQFRNVDPQSGVGSFMSGILETGHKPVALIGGREAPVMVGRSRRTIHLPEPFGERLVLEVPTTDTLIFEGRPRLAELHSWFYFGELPEWLFGAIRILQPHRRRWAYRLIERAARTVNARECAHAIAQGLGPEGLLHVTATAGGDSWTGHILFRDGAMATARLPVQIAQAYFADERPRAGLTTPLDWLEPGAALERLGTAALRVSLD